MRTAPKVALSLLISILLFSGLAVAAYAGLFNVLETRFYQPTVIASMDKQLESVSGALAEWHAANEKRFESFVNSDAVKRSLLPNQSAQDIFDRTNLAGALMADMPGLTGIRIIDATALSADGQEDKGTRRIHFSTFRDDILKKEDFLVSYKNYGRDDTTLPFKVISAPDGAEPKLITDPARDSFVYCFPFRDAFGAWRGTAAFYVSGRSAVNYLVSRSLARVSDELVLVSNEDGSIVGTVAGMPGPGRDILGNAIVDRWTRKNFSVDRLMSAGDSGWVLLSREIGKWGFSGELVQESLFAFPQIIRILFLAVSFLTIFLVVFMLFNLKQDGLIVIRHKIKRFQFQLLSELMENTDEVRWEEIRKNLAYRKHDINATLTKGFGRRLNKKYGKQIEELLEKSWDEILASVGGREEKQTAISNTEEIRLMLEQVLQNNAIHLNVTGVPARAASEPKAKAKSPTAVKAPAHAAPTEKAATGDAEDVEELSEVEEIEELAEEADEIEDLEELSDETEAIEEIEEVEELTEEPEELAEAEEIEELAEEPEEIGEVEEVEELTEEPAELSEAEEIAEAEIVEATEADETQPEVALSAEPLVEIEEPKDLLPPIDEKKILEELPLSDADIPEAEFIDEKWEPEELNEATEVEAESFIEDPRPDQVLVYNFDELPALDSSRGKTTAEEVVLAEAFSVSGLDFSSLDSSAEQAEHREEEATTVDYIDTFLLERMEPMTSRTDFGPVYEFLEVIGEEEPEPLDELGEVGADAGDSIISMDGIYLISAQTPASGEKAIDLDFKELVDSVLF